MLFELAWIIIADIESTGRETENPMSVKAWGSQRKKEKKRGQNAKRYCRPSPEGYGIFYQKSKGG